MTHPVRRGELERAKNYWNSKYPKATIFYKGRYAPGTKTKIEVDVRQFVTTKDSVIEKDIIEHDLIVRDPGYCDDDVLRIYKHTRTKSINPYKYEFDDKQFGGELWLYPYELRHVKRGDCDDWGIELASYLITAGVPAFRVRVVVGNTNAGGGHLTVYVLGDDLKSWRHLNSTSKIESIPVTFFSDLPKNRDKTDDIGIRNVWFSFNSEFAWHKFATEEDEISFNNDDAMRQIEILPYLETNETGESPETAAPAALVRAGSAALGKDEYKGLDDEDLFEDDPFEYVGFEEGDFDDEEAYYDDIARSLFERRLEDAWRSASGGRQIPAGVLSALTAGERASFRRHLAIRSRTTAHNGVETSKPFKRTTPQKTIESFLKAFGEGALSVVSKLVTKPGDRFFDLPYVSDLGSELRAMAPADSGRIVQALRSSLASKPIFRKRKGQEVCYLASHTADFIALCKDGNSWLIFDFALSSDRVYDNPSKALALPSVVTSKGVALKEALEAYPQSSPMETLKSIRYVLASRDFAKLSTLLTASDEPESRNPAGFALHIWQDCYEEIIYYLGVTLKEHVDEAWEIVDRGVRRAFVPTSDGRYLGLVLIGEDWKLADLGLGEDEVILKNRRLRTPDWIVRALRSAGAKSSKAPAMDDIFDEFETELAMDIDTSLDEKFADADDMILDDDKGEEDEVQVDEFQEIGEMEARKAAFDDTDEDEAEVTELKELQDMEVTDEEDRAENFSSRLAEVEEDEDTGDTEAHFVELKHTRMDLKHDLQNAETLAGLVEIDDRGAREDSITEFQDIEHDEEDLAEDLDKADALSKLVDVDQRGAEEDAVTEFTDIAHSQEDAFDDEEKAETLSELVEIEPRGAEEDAVTEFTDLAHTEKDTEEDEDKADLLSETLNEDEFGSDESSKAEMVEDTEGSTLVSFSPDVDEPVGDELGGEEIESPEPHRRDTGDTDLRVGKDTEFFAANFIPRPEEGTRALEFKFDDEEDETFVSEPAEIKPLDFEDETSDEKPVDSPDDFQADDVAISNIESDVDAEVENYIANSRKTLHRIRGLMEDLSADHQDPRACASLAKELKSLYVDEEPIEARRLFELAERMREVVQELARGSFDNTGQVVSTLDYAVTSFGSMLDQLALGVIESEYSGVVYDLEDLISSLSAPTPTGSGFAPEPEKEVSPFADAKVHEMIDESEVDSGSEDEVGIDADFDTRAVYQKEEGGSETEAFDTISSGDDDELAEEFGTEYFDTARHSGLAENARPPVSDTQWKRFKDKITGETEVPPHEADTDVEGFDVKLADAGAESSSEGAEESKESTIEETAQPSHSAVTDDDGFEPASDEPESEPEAEPEAAQKTESEPEKVEYDQSSALGVIKSLLSAIDNEDEEALLQLTSRHGEPFNGIEEEDLLAHFRARDETWKDWHRALKLATRAKKMEKDRQGFTLAYFHVAKGRFLGASRGPRGWVVHSFNVPAKG
ncbi:MAG: hypothetical protein NUW37_13575 [Planctomycetes bacterium]|nr:hypothetical protein [Planctomycetota bacterium]